MNQREVDAVPEEDIEFELFRDVTKILFVFTRDNKIIVTDEPPPVDSKFGIILAEGSTAFLDYLVPHSIGQCFKFMQTVKKVALGEGAGSIAKLNLFQSQFQLINQLIIGLQQNFQEAFEEPNVIKLTNLAEAIIEYKKDIATIGGISE